jgi:nucleotide-binding universal stress UspA family protein
VVTVRGRIVIGYDGSDEARCAIEFAARMFPESCALIVHVWHDPGVGMAPAPLAAPAPLDRARLEAKAEEDARRVAGEGARHALLAGFGTSIAVSRGAGANDTAQVLHEVAAEHEAALVVVARTHASWLAHLLHGSVSASAVREERRPVLVVPA